MRWIQQSELCEILLSEQTINWCIVAIVKLQMIVLNSQDSTVQPTFFFKLPILTRILEMSGEITNLRVKIMSWLYSLFRLRLYR